MFAGRQSFPIGICSKLSQNHIFLKNDRIFACETWQDTSKAKFLTEAAFTLSEGDMEEPDKWVINQV